MLVFAVGRWVLSGARKSPLALLAGAFAASLVPVMLHLSPWLEIPGPESVLRITRVCVAPLGSLGAAYALFVLAKGEPFLDRFAAPSRFWGLLSGLLAAPLALQAFLLLGAASQGGIHLIPRVLAEALWIDSYLAGIALLAWATRSSPAERLVLFLGIVWLLPALLADGGNLGRWVVPLAGPLLSRNPMGSFASGENSALPQLVGLCALFGSAWLFHVPCPARKA
ncbi:MAG: hypothetical protein CMJ89_03300 [Planctomycetes bacterium]|nr:hypothetical protein [Planctomycetota bacterium]